MYYAVAKQYRKSGFAAVLSLEGIPIYRDLLFVTKIGSLCFLRTPAEEVFRPEEAEEDLEKKRILLSDVPPIVFSEAAREVSILAGASRKK